MAGSEECVGGLIALDRPLRLYGGGDWRFLVGYCIEILDVVKFTKTKNEIGGAYSTSPALRRRFMG